MIDSLLRQYARAPYHPGKLRLFNFILRIPGMRVRVLELPNGRFEVDRYDLIGRLLWVDRSWEPQTLALVLRLCGGVERFVDLGAHMGWYAVSVANAVAGCKVFAVEANPATYRKLRRNIGLNAAGERVVAILGAYSREETLVSLVAAREENSGTARIAAGVGGNAADGVNYCPADWAGLERVMDGGKSCVVKLDLEGHDWSAIQDIVAHGRAYVEGIVFEYDPHCFGWPVAGVDLSRWFQERGYVVLTVDGKVWTGESKVPEYNLVAVREGSGAIRW